METFGLEKLEYEARPVVYGLASAYCLLNASEKKILFFSGLLLAFACCYVYKLRRDYRAKTKTRAW